MNTERVTATIYNDPERDRVALVTRRRWRIALSNGRRAFKASRRECIEWCEEMGVEYVVLSEAPQP